jgi:hypothetical protein
MNERMDPPSSCLEAHVELGKKTLALVGKNGCDVGWEIPRTSTEPRAGDPTCPNGQRADAPCPPLVVSAHEAFNLPLDVEMGRPQRAGETHLRAYFAGPGLREYRLQTRLGDSALLVAFDVAYPGR